jgi:transposase
MKIPFNKLAYLLHAFVLGVPAFRVHREVGINVRTIERVFRVFRHAIYDHSLAELHKLKGKLEMDETMFGGRRAGKRGWGAEGKTIVFGIYKRNGEVIVFPVPDRKAETLEPLIKQSTKKHSVYYTDDYSAYATITARGKHVTVIKKKGMPVIGHINGIEGFWSYAKTWLYHYRGVPRLYFHHYLKEIEFRFNNRNKNLFKQIAKILMNFGGAI